MTDKYLVPLVSESNIEVPENYTEQYNSIDGTTEEEKSMGSLKELAFLESPVGAIAKYMAVDEAEKAGGELLDPGQLNEMFTLEKPFTKPTTMRVANLMKDLQAQKFALQQQAQLGPDDTSTNIKKFATSLMYSMMDPITTGASLATGFGASALAARFGVTSARGILAADIAGNVAGNVATRPLNVLAANKANENFALTENLGMDIAAGVILPVAFKGLAKGLNSSYNALKTLGKTNPQAAEKVVASQIQRVIDGQPVDFKIVEDSLKTDIQGTGFMPYAHSEFSLDGRKLYSATTDADAVFVPDRVSNQGELFDEGVVYLSDDPNVANGMAARNTSEVDGTVFEHNLANAKLFDANELKAKNTDLAEIQAQAREQGFDGFYYSDTKGDGTKHNVVGMFDAQKISEAKPMKPMRSAVPDSVNPVDVKQLDFKERMLNESTLASHVDQINEILNTVDDPVPVKLMEDKQFVNDTIESLAEDVRFLDDPEIKQLFDELQKSVSTVEDFRKVVKAAIGCVGA